MSLISGSRRGNLRRAILGLATVLAVAGGASSQASGDPAGGPEPSAPKIEYRTIFQAPDASRAQDLVIENHAIALVNATPPASGSALRSATSTGRASSMP